MAEPADLPRWSTDESNESTPTSGQMDTGIVSGEAANSSRMNWLLRTIYEWILYFQSTERAARVRPASPHLARWVDGSESWDTSTFADLPLLGSGSRVYVPLAVEEGERLTTVVVKLREASDEVATLKVFRVDANASTEARTQLGSTQTSTPDSGATQKTLTVSGLTEDVGALHYSYVAEITRVSGSASIRLNSCLYTTTRPG